MTTVEIKYTDEERELNRLCATDRKEYENFYDKIIRSGKCIETRKIDGMVSHLVNGRMPTVIEWCSGKGGNPTPIRWRFHKYLNADEIAMLVAQLKTNTKGK